MKKTYAAPTVLGKAPVVRETLGGPIPVGEGSNLETFSAGGLGFYL